MERGTAKKVNADIVEALTFTTAVVFLGEVGRWGC